MDVGGDDHADILDPVVVFLHLCDQMIGQVAGGPDR